MLKQDRITKPHELKVILGSGRYSRLISINYKVSVSSENIVSLTFSIDQEMLKNVEQIAIERSQDGCAYYSIVHWKASGLRKINSYTDFSSNLFVGLWYRMRIKHKCGLEVITKPVFNQAILVGDLIQ